jgi:hypothetical protein
MSDMPAYFRLVLHPNPGILKTDNRDATGITKQAAGASCSVKVLRSALDIY